MPMPLPVHPGGTPWARAAGRLNKSNSSPASNVTQLKGPLGLRQRGGVVRLGWGLPGVLTRSFGPFDKVALVITVVFGCFLV